MIKKISGYQLFFLLLISRCFSLMTYVPLFSQGQGSDIRFKAIVISVIIQGLLVIPLIMLNKKHPDKSVTEIISEKSKPWGYFSQILYLLFFVTLCTGQSVRYLDFLGSGLSVSENSVSYRLIPLAALLIVCGYCSYCGIEGLARSSVVIFIPFLAMLFLMTIQSGNSFHLRNFYCENNNNGLFEAVSDELVRNGEIIGAAYLMKNVRSGLQKGLYLLLAAKLTVTAFITALFTGVLGDYADLCDYPFLTVGSFTNSELFRHNDALYLILWTISAVISISIFLCIIDGIFSEMTHKKMYISAILVFFTAAIFGEHYFTENLLCGGFMQLLLITIIPTVFQRVNYYLNNY